MKILSLVLHEIRFRKVNFLMGLIAVAAAAACFVGALTLLHSHDRVTERMIAGVEQEAQQAYQHHNAAMTRITRNMGFNTLILPRGQDVAQFVLEGRSSHFVDESRSDALAEARLVTLNHLLPVLRARVTWEEQRRDVYVQGVKGVVYVAQAWQAPLQENVEPGQVMLGHRLHEELGLSEGQVIRLNGRELTVVRTLRPRGPEDDVTMLLNLGEVQAMLDQPGRINAIYALSCTCPDQTVSDIEREVAKVLDDVQVHQFSHIALARDEARIAAQAMGRERMTALRAHREDSRRERASLIAVLVPLVVVISALWVGLVTLGNVRERRAEIGVMRAIGFRSRQIQSLFLARAGLMGLIGALVGFSAAWAVSGLWVRNGAEEMAARELFQGWLLAVVLIGAPVLAALASMVPAQLASIADPSEILREE